MDNVFDTPADNTADVDSIPGYMLAANNHNTGNLNDDMFGDFQPKRTLANRALNMLGSASLSAVNSFYNTAVWAGNMFSDEGAKYRDTRDWIASFDEDMGQYYNQNRQAADLLGFVVGSFVPGLGGVKVFNAGAKALTAAKEGVMGVNMARGLGVLPGARNILIKEASESFATSRIPFTLSNPQTMKAIGAGFGEQVLQSAAFEVAVAATMKKSPILSDLDAGDMLANIATGAILGGAIGGVFEGVGAVRQIKRGIATLDTKLAGVTQIVRGVEGTSLSDSIVMRRNDLDTLARNAPEGVPQSTYDKLWEQKITAIDNEDRKAFSAITGGNAEVGNRLYEGIRTDGTGEYSAKLLGLVEVGVTADAGKLSKKYGLESDSGSIIGYHGTKAQFDNFSLEAFGSATDAGFYGKGVYFTNSKEAAQRYAGNEGRIIQSKLDFKKPYVTTETVLGDATLASIKQQGYDGIISEAAKAKGYIEYVAFDTATIKKMAAESNTHAVRHFKLWGEQMGKMSDDAPSALHLADTLAKGQTITVRAGNVTAGKLNHKINPGKYWNAAEASYEDAMARNIWAMDDTVPKLQVPKGKDALVIGDADLPMLTKAYREGFMQFNFVDKAGEVYISPLTRQELLEHIGSLKNDMANFSMEQALAKGGTETAEHIANRYDVPLGFLTGEQYSKNVEDAIFGLSKAQKEYYQKFVANTVNPPPVEAVKPWMHQQNYQMIYDTTKTGTVDNFQVEAMTLIKQRQKIQQETNEIAVRAALGDKSGLLPEFTDAQLTKVNRGGAGAGFLSFANANYGSAGSLAEYVGSLTTRWIREAEQMVGDAMMSVNYQIVNSPEDMTRLATVMQKVRGAGSEKYVLDEGGAGLILRSVRDYRNKLAEGLEATPPIIPQGIDETIPFGSEAVQAWAANHITLNGDRLSKLNNIRGAKGQPSSLDPDTFYSPAPNPDRFKFHAFVVDDAQVTSTGHTKMLYADSARNLEKQMDEARTQGFNVFTPDDTADYYKARGKYDYSEGLNESQLDSALRSTGSSAPAFPLTGNPQEMIQDIMQWHAQREAIVIREAVSTKYSQQFGVLNQMGEEYNKVANAKIGFFNKMKSPPVNPFEDYVKTFLGASLKKDYPLWTAVNNFVDEAGQKVWDSVSSVWKGSKNAYDIDKVGKIMSDYGMQMASTPAQMEAWVNHPAGRGAVSKFITTQNSILSSLVLRLDPVNALNNAVGSPILVGAETRSILDIARRSGDPDLIGSLGAMSQIGVPGTDSTITASGKLIGAAYKNYFSQGSKELLEQYRKKGFVTDTTTQFKQLIEDATIEGTETAAQLESKTQKMYQLAKKLADTGEKWTGNRMAEEMNRFVSANVMDQLTSPLVAKGLMDKTTADTYINTFVNRTQGNVIASQRPQIFQGPVGQAIGLFQSYQFNIMQQLLRYVGEGSKKDAFTLLGLQGTVYGMNGLPAFQAINQHIIGNASGNTNHTDAYNSVYNIAGKTAADWIMYGAASNMLIDPDLKINLYSRGDINPRSVTVVPSNMADIPIVSSWAKLAGSIQNSLTSVANGGDMWQTFLTGVEQQGLNRPLAGLARVARGAGDGGVSYSTSGKGNIVSANDFYSLANLARVSGAKPFDEAVTQDAVFRIQSYQAKDKALRDSLGKAVKSVIAAGGDPSDEQLNSFMSGYVRSGGKQEEFNKWYVSQVKTMNTPQANKISEKVGSPYATYLQSIMGGRLMATPPDFTMQAPAQAE